MLDNCWDITKKQMSKLRKIRRMMASLNKPRKDGIKITPSDVILGIGFILLIIGIIAGGLNYLYHTGGRPEGIVQTRTGTYYHERQPPGNPNRKDAAILGAIGVGLGLILTASALLTKSVFKNVKETEQE